MSQTYSVSLEKMIDFHKLETVYMPRSADEILITTSEVNRPGIVLTGYTDYFDSLRIQILGWTEIGFIRSMEPDEREAALDCWLSLKPAAAVVTRGLEIPDYLYDACKKHEIPLLKTEEETSPFLAALIEFLNTELAPRITRHGVLVEVYGEGVLITGESGAGKSETAIELIKRGHRLIADDAVEIRPVLLAAAAGVTAFYLLVVQPGQRIICAAPFQFVAEGLQTLGRVAVLSRAPHQNRKLHRLISSYITKTVSSL